MNKKYTYILLIITLVSGLMTSCLEIPDKVDTSKDAQYTSDIVGRWRKASESDQDPTGHYLYYVYRADGWGYTWDEGDDFTEQETLENEYTNGWFEWSIYNAKLTEKHHFKSSSSISAKTYTIRQLTDTQLAKYDEAGNKTQMLNRVK